MGGNAQRLLPLGDTPLHRERDRPKGIKPWHWSALIDRICVRGGVRLTHEALLFDFHRCCPGVTHRVAKIADLTLVDVCNWEWYWERWHPWTEE